jgi:hypothetical protein
VQILHLAVMVDQVVELQTLEVDQLLEVPLLLDKVMTVVLDLQEHQAQQVVVVVQVQLDLLQHLVKAVMVVMASQHQLLDHQ